MAVNDVLIVNALMPQKRNTLRAAEIEPCPYPGKSANKYSFFFNISPTFVAL
ncbi:MAG: hypothetical protein J6A47_02175 [Bacilli bacterium]|nr:hypothetical protein [Bacilli bacterium]